MNLQSLKMKASTLCAGGTLLVFGGFLTVNLAGCGGGGGGGLTTVPTPRPLGATFRILQQDGTASNGGTVTLTNGTQTYTANADSSGVAVLNNVPVGNYTVTFTAVGSNGSTSSTTRTLSITRSGAQNYTLVQGDTGNGPNTISGTIFLNDGNGTATNRACTATSSVITADNILISVRDLNDTTGSPIVAQLVRGTQSNGRYTISVPNLTGQRTFRVEVSSAGNSGFQPAGVSQTTTFVDGTTALTNVDVCANTNGVIPAPVVTPTPTPSPSGTPFSVATPTPSPTNDDDADATATATATAAAGATATATAGPAATATAAARATATATRTPFPMSTGIVIPVTTPTAITANTPFITSTPISNTRR